MPATSKAQFRLMQVILNNSKNIRNKVPKKVAKEFVEKTPKGSFSKLKEKVSK